MKDVELKLCPFCGGKAKIVCCDDEGNIKYNPEYEKSPWSGLGYRITHSHEENIDCPIAEYEEDASRRRCPGGARQRLSSTVTFQMLRLRMRRRRHIHLRCERVPLLP